MSRTAIVVMLAFGTLLAGACSDDFQPGEPPECPALDLTASIADLSGSYRYQSHLFSLRGTITFEQTGATVSVVQTTYDVGNDRPLVGEGQLEGNQLTTQLVPENGDTDYTADVVFVFTADAEMFCVAEFSDTNGDVGGFGSYSGDRIDQ